jgi:toxin ParE1/3/4
VAYRLARRARRDVIEIWRYIAEDDEAAADRFIDLLTHHFRILGTNPYIGRRRDELRLGYRSFPVGEYQILYRVAKPGVNILHVGHGRRDLGSLFAR